MNLGRFACRRQRSRNEDRRAYSCLNAGGDRGTLPEQGEANRSHASGCRPPWLSGIRLLRASRSSLRGAHLGDPFLELSSEVRHDAQLPLDQHQLSAMVHLVFLGAEQVLEA